jgi:DNA-binding beta-propeller fold protein YncE
VIAPPNRPAPAPARRSRRAAGGAALLAACCLAPPLAAQPFVHWESPHVHPLDLTPGAALLLAVNTADATLELFDVATGAPVPVDAIPVGLDPVSVRARTATEAWVVNRISDSVSIVDLAARTLARTLRVCDEPADVVFAGTPLRAFVACERANRLLVFDAAAPALPGTPVPLAGESPRALAAAPDGSRVYAAFHDSGNGSTILAGGAANQPPQNPEPVNDPAGPYGGVNPPPNDGLDFRPPIREEYLPDGAFPAPRVGLIVRKDEEGRWLDDNAGDWTGFVSGADAAQSGRPPGWDLPDRDVAIVDANSLAVAYATRLLTTPMALGVRADGTVTVVGTEATNEIRFEPNLKGRFVRVEMASFAPQAPASAAIVDLNAGHLDYSDEQIAAQSAPETASQALRDRSLGDPRAIVWNGARGYVAGMGSGNLIVVDAAGNRLAPLGAPGAATVELGDGPTGLALDPVRSRLYALDRFGAKVVALDLATEQPVASAALHDATPAAIRDGRRHLFSTRATSALGQLACASCHVDARVDRLAWDLGDPGGDIKPVDPGEHNLGLGLIPEATFQDFHPMKGPMLTQTLQDIVGKEPHHWRGDRDGLEEFAGAFRSLLGDDVELSPSDLQQLEEYLARIAFPPNPFRPLDNSLPTNLLLPGHFSTGRFAGQGGLPPGAPLPPGNAQNGLTIFRPPRRLDGGAVACSGCHTFPTGAGGDVTASGLFFTPIPPGPNGEAHLGLVSVDGSTNVTMKIPHLRNLAERTGFELTQSENLAGFGYLHDGSIDSIARFVSAGVFQVANDQEVADLVALMLAWPGGDLPSGSILVAAGEPPGPPSLDTHAAVGVQQTVDGGNQSAAPVVALLAQLQALADEGAIGLVAKGMVGGEARGFRYLGGGAMDPDRAEEATTTLDALRLGATNLAPMTFTAVPADAETRLGVDRDQDTYFDRDELDVCSDPADAAVTPANWSCAHLFLDGFESGDTSTWSAEV